MGLDLCGSINFIHSINVYLCRLPRWNDTLHFYIDLTKVQTCNTRIKNIALSQLNNVMKKMIIIRSKIMQ